MQTLKAYLTKPSTYVLLAVGIILAFAYGRYLKPLRAAASKLPKSEA